MNIHIDGDREGFNSKSAVDKFKTAVRSQVADSTFDVVKLTATFIKPTHILELLERDDNTIRFRIVMKTMPKKEDDATLKNEFRMKLKMMKKNRTNNDAYKSKMSEKVPPEILNEYLKLKNMSLNGLQVPDPMEILSKQEQYKPIFPMLLQNPMIKSYGMNHPYTRYLRSLAEHMGIDLSAPVAMPNFQPPVNNVNNVSEPVPDLINATKESDEPQVVDIRGNQIDAGADTDDED